MALKKKILMERDKGTPVTIINDIARGSIEIADLKLKRDIAESSYEAVREACNVYKLEMKLLDNQIQREWGSAKC